MSKLFSDLATRAVTRQFTTKAAEQTIDNSGLKAAAAIFGGGYAFGVLSSAYRNISNEKPEKTSFQASEDARRAAAKNQEEIKVPASL
jgi:hypothetical protein